MRGKPLPPNFPEGTQMNLDLNAFADVFLKKHLEPAL
jgi:hypothetical protein